MFCSWKASLVKAWKVETLRDKEHDIEGQKWCKQSKTMVEV